jgi:hypothetical protein
MNTAIDKVGSVWGRSPDLAWERDGILESDKDYLLNARMLKQDNRDIFTRVHPTLVASALRRAKVPAGIARKMMEA